MSTCQATSSDCPIKVGSIGAKIVVTLKSCETGLPYDLATATKTDLIAENTSTLLQATLSGTITDSENGVIEFVTDGSLTDVGWYRCEIDLVTSAFSGRSQSFEIQVAEVI